jgi:hypothetical protein
MSLLLFIELDGISIAAEENANADNECGKGEADDKADYEVGVGSRV